METLYLLVETEVGGLDEVRRRLLQEPKVVEVEAVTVPYDLVVKVRAPHINKALDVEAHRIRRLPGIEGIETLVTMSGP